jgi:glutamate 5-kinase
MELREQLKDVRRVVIKVGSNVITKEDGTCDLRRMRIIVEDICDLQEKGIEVVLVSSGAVNVGKAFLQKYLPNKIELQQSASAIGQPKLINKYSHLFEENGKICSQILLTHEDFKNRKRFLNAKKTLDVLIQNSVIPILNENDTISFTEITVGDNDHLAAQAAQMINADLLLIITSANGLYDRDPSAPDAQLIKYVGFGEKLSHIDMTSKTASGRGGMQSKINAVEKATQVGIKCIVSSKDNERIVMDPLVQEMGTLFDTNKEMNPELRKSWLITTKRLNCYIDVNKTAYESLLGCESLLSNGIIKAAGAFYKGDCVELRYNGEIFAVGMSEYDRTEVDRMKRRQSCKVIQKVNMVVNGGTKNERTSTEV